MLLTKKEAAIELLARRKARASLAGWIDYRDAGYVPAKHHLLLIDKLEALERGDIKKLMVCMPPGSAKSTYTSIEFPAWYLGRNKKHSVIAASHTQELADRFGRRVRNIVADAKFGACFAASVAADSAAAGRWDLSDGGEYFAAGVGGSITGRRADLGLIDDPVKSREDADSERSRQKAWDWYVNDFLTRLKPNSKQVIVMTRWHEDDLGGRILERERNEWDVLELPMEAMPNDPLGRKVGEILWGDWFTPDMVLQAKQDTRTWNALYQQQPAGEEGDYFKADWFGEYTDKPEKLRIYGASDYAVTDGGGDYTEHGVFGVDSNDNIYVLDWWRGQTAAHEWIESMADLVNEHLPSCWFGESGVIRRSIEPALIKRLQERNAYCRIEWLASQSDKEARARGIQARAAMGKVFFPKNAVWKSDIVGQLLRFPAGKHDDAVDVFSLVGRGIDLVKGTKVVNKPKVVHNTKHYSHTGWMA